MKSTTQTNYTYPGDKPGQEGRLGRGINKYTPRRAGAIAVSAMLLVGGAKAIDALGDHVGASSTPGAIPEGEMTWQEQEAMRESAQATAQDNAASTTETDLATGQINPAEVTTTTVPTEGQLPPVE